MSAFISSAVAGKKVAPKAPARRRAAPPPPPSQSQSQPRRRPPPESEPEPASWTAGEEYTPGAPLSPPPTQRPTEHAPADSQFESPATAAPTSRAAEARPPVKSLRAPDPIPSEPQNVESSTASHAQAHPSSVDVITQVLAQEVVPPSDGASIEETPALPNKAVPAGKKRQRKDEGATASAKRPKRSSARNNAKTQTLVNQDQPNASTAQDNTGTATSSAVAPEEIVDTAERTRPAEKGSEAAPKRKVTRRKLAKSAETVPLDGDSDHAGETAPTSASAAKATKTANARKATAARGTAKARKASAATAPAEANDETPGDQVAGSDPIAAIEESTAAADLATKKKSRATKKAPAGSKTPPIKKKRQRRNESPSEQPQQDDQDGEQVPSQDQDRDGDASDPEAHEIDPKTLSMYELSHDTRHGRVSEREKKMAEIDWDEVAQKRREAIERVIAGEQPEQEQAPAGDVVESTEDAGGASKSPRERATGSEQLEDAAEGRTETQDEAETAASTNLGTSGGPSFRIVNGQIVVDEATLTIDRVAEAQAQMANDEPVEEENDLTVRINRATWVNDRRREPAERIPMWRSKSDPWSEDDTDRFYDALRMFGTDFFIISKMFAPKTRKQIKLKFVREEKLDPLRINNALLGKETKPMDLDHYAKESGRDVSVFTKYESFEQAEEVIRASMKDKEAAMQEAIAEETENARQAEIAQGQKEKQKAAAERRRAEKRAAKKRGKMGAGTMGGGPEEESAAEAG